MRDNKSDIAKGTESQIDDVAKTERDKAAEAKTDAVAENKTGGVPQKCDSKTNVERSTEAPQQQQQPQQPSSSTDDAGTSAQRIVEQVVDVPVETGAGVQRTVEQVIDVPDDAEEQAQPRTVEQIVSVGTEATEAATTTLLDKAELDVTQHVTHLVQAKAAPKFECSLRHGKRLELERVRYQEQAKRRFKRARERSAERQREALQRGSSFEEAASARAFPP